ncbi:MAG: alpha/beta hydrolase [Chitinophagales bacterium]|nr:alpha/beta hydrolase [Chitinophagales bacterium]
MQYEIKEENNFKFIEVGEGDVLLLLHGLFGALSNFRETINFFSPKYKVVIPILPLYDLEPNESTVTGLVEYVENFIEYKKYPSVSILGNSLGGHIGLIYTLRNKEKVKALILTGSSGLFESALGDGYPKKGDYEYVKKKTEETFYDPKTASKELVDEVYNLINDRSKALKILLLAKSAVRNNLEEELKDIDIPVKLIWGMQDIITPVFVGEKFEVLLPNSELTLLDRCGHAAMMERPHEFNQILSEFLERVTQPTE